MPENDVKESSPVHAYKNPHADKKKFSAHFTKDRNKLIALIFVLFALPVTVVLALTQQNYLNFASSNEIGRVDINPGSISANIETPPPAVQMSTLAFDTDGNPITSGVTYEWSISSQNEAGTLTKTNGDLSGFIAKNYGCGVITVVARYNDQTFTKSAGVEVFSGVSHPNCETVVSPTPSSYTLMKSEEGTVTFAVSAPNTGYGISAILKDESGNVVVNQSDFSYTWTIDDPGVISGSAFDACTNGVGEPCPEDHFSMRGLNPGSTNVNLVVKQISTQKIVATSIFPIEVIAPTKTPTPTPTSTPTPTPSPTPLPGNKVVSLKPTADAFVRSNQINKNFGTQTTLEAVSDPNSMSLFKFNLKSLAGKTIVKATLNLKVSDKSIGAQMLRRGDDKAWGETTVTFANKPANVAAISQFISTSVGQGISLPVTNAVNLKKGGNITFIITSSGTDKVSFYSRESGANAPTLTVEYK